MNTVPTTPTDAETCDLSWCDQPPHHDGRHIRHAGLVQPTPWNTVAAVLVTIEAGAQETDPLPVVSLVGKHTPRLSARLTWREAGSLANLLARTIENHDPGGVLLGRVASVDVSTDHSADDWERALLRIGASGTLEATGTAVVVEHDATDDTLRIHAPERTDVDRVREAIRAAAVALGIV